MESATINRLNVIVQPMRCRNNVEKTTLIVLVTILFSRFTFYSCIMSHSANGEEFLSFAKILIYIYFCSTILPFICKYVLIKMIDYLTFTAVTGILNTSVHLFF